MSRGVPRRFWLKKDWGSGGRRFESGHPDQFSIWGHTGDAAAKRTRLSSAATMSNRRGRPKLDPNDATEMVTVAMPSRMYARLDAEARQVQTSLSAVIRRKLCAAQRTDRTDDPKSSR